METVSRHVRRPTLTDLDRARVVVRDHLPPTPVSLPAVPDDAGIALKLETLQPTGAFKVRGALAALAVIEPEREVVTASAGNHGLGVAFAATRLGRRATVVTAKNASPAKVGAIRRFGIEMVQVGDSYDAAEGHALELASQGAYYLSPYNDPDVIAGQGTVGPELAEQIGGPLTVVCGVGGGGLASGLGLWASTCDDVQVVGVEVEVSTAVSAAVAAGGQVPVEVGDTLADGMAGNIEPGSVTVDMVARYVDRLVTVSEAEIRAALRWLAFHRGVVAEGAGAAPVAAALAGKVSDHGQVVAVVTGRNIAAPVLAEVLAGTD